LVGHPGEGAGVPAGGYPVLPGVEIDSRVDLAEVVGVPGEECRVPDQEHGTALVVDDHLAVVDAGGPDTEQGQPPGRPVGSSTQVR
jgi:hypothetical protein